MALAFLALLSSSLAGEARGTLPGQEIFSHLLIDHDLLRKDGEECLPYMAPCHGLSPPRVCG